MTKKRAAGIPQQDDISEYLKFEPHDLDETRRTVVVDVISKSSGETLGVVQWYGPWRQYTFLPNAGTIWNGRCLADVFDLLGRMMRQRKIAGIGSRGGPKNQASTDTKKKPAAK